MIHQAITIFLMGCLTAGLSYLLTFLRTEPVTDEHGGASCGSRSIRRSSGRFCSCRSAGGCVCMERAGGAIPRRALLRR